MQGYLFSRPLPADAMGALLEEGRRLKFEERRRA
jgi:EAL domain-containing protein (putative c-di-GMP-specific phosphodiesterase class I)